MVMELMTGQYDTKLVPSRGVEGLDEWTHAWAASHPTIAFRSLSSPASCHALDALLLRAPHSRSHSHSCVLPVTNSTNERTLLRPCCRRRAVRPYRGQEQIRRSRGVLSHPAVGGRADVLPRPGHRAQVRTRGGKEGTAVPLQQSSLRSAVTRVSRPPPAPALALMFTIFSHPTPQCNPISRYSHSSCPASQRSEA